MTETIIKNAMLSRPIAELTDGELKLAKTNLKTGVNTFLETKICDEWVRDLEEYNKSQRSRKARLKAFLFSMVKNAIEYQQFIRKYNIQVDDRVIETLDFIINKLEKYPKVIAVLFKAYTENPFFKEYNQNSNYFKLKYLLYREVIINYFKKEVKKWISKQ